MIEQWLKIICDTCHESYTIEPVLADNASSWPADYLLRFAEEDGWKVNRLVKDIYYGRAICPWCQED